MYVSSQTSATKRSGRVPLKVLIGYAAPELPTSFLGAAIGFYLLKYSTDVLLLAPATMGLIFALARIWDAVSDPLVGYLSDRTRAAFGRRRLWISFSVAPMLFAYIAIWLPPEQLSHSLTTLWMLASILVYYTAHSAYAVPHAALGVELTSNYHERSRVFGWRAMIEQAGVIGAAGWIFLMENGDAPRTIAMAAIAVGGTLLLVSVRFLIVRVKERGDFLNRGGKGAFQAFHDVLQNGHARILLGVFFFEMLGFQTFITLLPFGTEYVLGTPGKTAVYLATAIVAIIAAIPFWVRLSRRFDKKIVWLFALALKTVIFSLIWFVGEGRFLLVAAVTLLFGTFHAATLVLGPSMKADVIDTDDLLTGERKEGVYFAAWNLVTKAGIGMAIAVGGLSLSLVGFSPNIEQSPDTVAGLRFMMSWFPVLCQLPALYLLSRLRLSAESHQLVSMRLAERA